jgi:hypothetical protein
MYALVGQAAAHLAFVLALTYTLATPVHTHYGPGEYGK